MILLNGEDVAAEDRIKKWVKNGFGIMGVVGEWC